MSAQMVQAVGTSLLHFFWEGAALALVLSIAIACTRNPRVRYGLAVGTLVLMALCPLATFAFLEKPVAVAPSSTVASYPAISNVTVALGNDVPVTSFDLLSAFVWVWCSGVCLFGVRALGGWLILQKLRRTAQDAISPVLLARCRRLQERIGIKALVRYAYSEIVDAPAVVGWFRPVVLIPLSAISGLSTEQLEAIIVHELAHVRRYDAVVNLFQIAVETVLFYHPAVWWVNRVIRTERENCCDDIAVAVCGNAHEYARALATMGTARPSWAMASNGGELKARVGRLLGMQKMTHGIPRTGLAVFAVLCASCLVMAAGAFKQDAPSAPPVPPPPVVEPPVPVAPEPSPTPEPLVAPLSRATRSETSRLAPLPPLPPEVPPTPEQEPPATEHSGSSYIDSLAAVGLTKLSADDLIGLKIQGVTADYVRQIKAAGFDPNVHELMGLKIQGVTPEYIRDIRATGLKPNIRELMGMKIQGITPEFIKAMQSAGFGELPIRDLMGAKIQGITPEFIEKVRSHGFKDLTFRQLLGLKMANVF